MDNRPESTRHRDRPVLTTAVLGVLCAAALGVATNVATAALPEAWRPHLWIAWPVLAVLIVVIVVLEIRRSRAGAEDVPFSNVRARTVLLERVHRYWIKGVLERSFYQQVRIDLGLEATIDAVHPWDVVLAEPDQQPRLLVPGTPARTVFEDLDQAMLVLGAPGSGKTTMLLELLRDLLADADADTDTDKPIPVLLTLSSWAQRRENLDEWMVREVSERYRVSPRHVRAWLADDQLLPLLDGLDEVAATHREACVEAINDFQRAHGIVPIAVGCRLADYEELQNRLETYGTLRLQPLTPEQVHSFMDQLGPAADGARTALVSHPELQELMVSPLMLSILLLAFHSGTRDGVPVATGGTDDHTTRLFQTFVATMLRRRPSPTYSPYEILSSLALLANMQLVSSRTLFRIDDIDYFWVPLDFFSRQPRLRHLRRWPQFLAILVFSILGLGVLAAVGYALYGWLGAILGGFVGLAFGVPAKERIDTAALIPLPEEDDQFVFSGTLEKWVFPLIDPSVILSSNPLVAWIAAPTGVLAGVLLGWSGGWLSVIAHAIAGAIAVLVAAGLSWGYGATLVDLPARPYRAELPSPKVRTVLRTGVLLAPLIGLVVGGLCWLILSILTDVDAHPFTLLGGIGATLYALTCFGIYVVVEQALVRRTLHKAGLFPLPAKPLLDHATGCLFLNKVGDAYLFSHELLLDFFSQLPPAGYSWIQPDRDSARSRSQTDSSQT